MSNRVQWSVSLAPNLIPRRPLSSSYRTCTSASREFRPYRPCPRPFNKERCPLASSMVCLCSRPCSRADVQNVDIWKVRIQVIIEAFTQMATVTEAENYVLYLFWLALSLLESSPLTHSFIYCSGLELLTAVIVCPLRACLMCRIRSFSHKLPKLRSSRLSHYQLIGNS